MLSGEMMSIFVQEERMTRGSSVGIAFRQMIIDALSLLLKKSSSMNVILEVVC